MVRYCGPAAVEGRLLTVPRERAEQRRDSLQLKADDRLDRASILTVGKV